MNQPRIIANLNYSLQGQERIFEMGLNGYVTSQKLLSMGMYSCWTCGFIGSVDSTHCSSCGDEKFILTHDHLNFTYLKRKKYTIKIA